MTGGAERATPKYHLNEKWPSWPKKRLSGFRAFRLPFIMMQVNIHRCPF